MAPDPSTQTPLPAAAVARRLGIAPATLRTWDRRYGVGPKQHQAGQHRRYTAADLARLEAIQNLVLQGVTVADAAQQIGVQTTSRRRRGRVEVPGPGTTIATPGPARPVTSRHVRETALRLDADRLVTLLHRAVGDLGVIDAWDTVVRPALVWLGERWQSNDSCIAAEHVLSDCASAVFTSLARRSSVASTRPALLVCAPGDEHVLPLHALAAALTERRVRNCVIGPSTPVSVTAEAIRRLNPATVLVWSQLEQTADPAALTEQPRIRSGHRMAAAGPGWAHLQLPARVERPDSMGAAVALLAGAAGE
ncbi:MerR family transcriptional regulator [Sporichthya sp.]|uniref:MerR family transcriptional regulator n=1 Tax=Sporichthya sp. TaxID=65475 RepID=UPI0017B9AC00|nr:MerR family transcriptional regulator [Sporichthya sp.]MBA3744649.1 MerR family transcriptional regulator [Sporichthya sp.]